MLIYLFAGILVLMVGMTVWASLERNVLDNGHLMRDRWFLATLADAYCGFITFYVWVAYRESSWLGRVLWFVAIMGLGNMAMAVYMLLQLWRHGSEATVPEQFWQGSRKGFVCLNSEVRQ